MQEPPLDPFWFTFALYTTRQMCNYLNYTEDPGTFRGPRRVCGPSAVALLIIQPCFTTRQTSGNAIYARARAISPDSHDLNQGAEQKTWADRSDQLPLRQEYALQLRRSRECVEDLWKLQQELLVQRHSTPCQRRTVFEKKRKKKIITIASRFTSLSSFEEHLLSTRLFPLHPSVRQMCRPQQIPARPSSVGSSLRTCLPCHAREKEHRHHFDCSSQPQHCRSTVCQAHSLLVSKISHSGQGNCRV